MSQQDASIQQVVQALVSQLVQTAGRGARAEIIGDISRNPAQPKHVLVHMNRTVTLPPIRPGVPSNITCMAAGVVDVVTAQPTAHANVVDLPIITGKSAPEGVNLASSLSRNTTGSPSDVDMSFDHRLRGPIDRIVVPGVRSEFAIVLEDRDTGRRHFYGVSQNGIWSPPKSLDPELQQRLESGWGATAAAHFGQSMVHNVPVDVKKINGLQLHFQEAVPRDLQCVARTYRLLRHEEDHQADKRRHQNRVAEMPYDDDF